MAVWKAKTGKVYRRYRGYQKNPINFLRKFATLVQFNGRRKRLQLHVSTRGSLNLIGRNWFEELGIAVLSYSHIQCQKLPTLAGSKIFAKLDLEQAYQQLKVNEETALAQTIITHKGLYKPTRIQFGIHIAPQIFQRFMDQRLAGIEGVFPYYDDVLGFKIGKNGELVESLVIGYRMVGLLQ